MESGSLDLSPDEPTDHHSTGLEAREEITSVVPDKLMADRAKRGLREKRGRELMALHMVDFGLFDGSSAMVQGEESFVLKVTHVLCVCGERAEDAVKQHGGHRGAERVGT